MDNRKVRLLLSIALTFVLGILLCLVCYQYDNKYTTGGPKAKNGLLDLKSIDLKEQPLFYLVEGWEYYSDRLLKPRDFDESTMVPDEYIYIGQYSGFEKYNKSSSPHGSASYRLKIRLPEEPQYYTLELTEVFSSYILYLNGEAVFQMGNPDPGSYQSETGNRTVTVKTAGEIDILLAVTDYSHLYSGMVYPLAFGTPEAVSSLLSGRLVFRSLLCAAALIIGLLSILIGFLAGEKSYTLLFGVICLCLVGYAGYPLTRSLAGGLNIPYMVENLCFCILLAVLMLLTRLICNMKSRWTLMFPGTGAAMYLLTIITHALLPSGNLRLMLVYSRLVSAYEWLAAGFITAALVYAGLCKAKVVYPLLCGVIIFDCTLVMDRLLPLHEPILTGWFIELSSFILVICFGVYIGQEVAHNYRNTAIINERAGSMERLYQSQLQYYSLLKSEIAKTKRVRHDMRHHITLLNGFVKSQQYQKLADYTDEYRDIVMEGDIPEYCPINVINVLTHYYLLAAKENHIQLDIRCDLDSACRHEGQVQMSDADLCCLYSNLIENAMEACMRIKSGPRYIRIAVVCPGPGILMIQVINSCREAKQINRQFYSTKNSKNSGVGLLSIQAVTEKYHGNTSFKWNEKNQEFISNAMVII